MEPDIKYFCDITYDPFMKMIEMNKTYGFTIAIKELRETVPNLFRYTSAYKRNNNLTSKGLWEMFLERPDGEEAGGPEDAKDEATRRREAEQARRRAERLRNRVPGEVFVADGDSSLDIDPEEMEGESYNMCHFWSNFEIARLDWFRSK
ncbi:alpha-1,2-mannosyltransferase (Kre5), partial [Ascosphaera acerosa]